MSFEESLVCHASPTLASIKVANLYNFKFKTIEDCNNTLKSFNSIMNPKGIYIELLKNSGNFYLIYVYRRKKLISDLNNSSIKSFLLSYGYPDNDDINSNLLILKNRLKNNDFPHEIGVFLGYPLDDVKSFISDGGQNSIMCGDWQVYHNENNARCMFCKYERCRRIYAKVYNSGRRFSDMLVRA